MMKQHLRDLLGGVGSIGFPQRNGINQVQKGVRDDYLGINREMLFCV